MRSYHELVERILANGITRSDRTGVGTIALFGETLRHDMRQGFPLLTTKAIIPRLPFAEVLWMLSGESSTRVLHENGAHFWDKWSVSGDLGRVYGVQWRNWRGYLPFCNSESGTPQQHVFSGTPLYAEHTHDQIADLLHNLAANPTSRRLLVSAWNAGELGQMALPPCPYSFQLLCEPSAGWLSMIVNWRSVDVGVGLPFDLAAYGLLLEMICKVSGYKAKELICSMADCHVYLPHIDALKEQLKREPRQLPIITLLGDHDNLDTFRMIDFSINEYHPWPAIKMEAFL